MIVRISGEGQYRLADSETDRLNELERAVLAAVDDCEEDLYVRTFGALLDEVRGAGERLPDEDLEGSDVILPPADTTLAEAAREFTGEGLIPD
jgi:hypothetical protein